MTFYEFNLYFEAYNEKKIDEFKKEVTIAYFNAYFQRVERMPNLSNFLKKFDKKDEMNDNEMFNIIKDLNSKYGGD